MIGRQSSPGADGRSSGFPFISLIRGPSSTAVAGWRATGEAEHERTRGERRRRSARRQTNPARRRRSPGRSAMRAPIGDSSHERPRGERCQNPPAVAPRRRAARNLNPAHSSSLPGGRPTSPSGSRQEKPAPAPTAASPMVTSAIRSAFCLDTGLVLGLLLVPERLHRIHLRRPPRRDVTRQQLDRCQRKRHTDKTHRIKR